MTGHVVYIRDNRGQPIGWTAYLDAKERWTAYALPTPTSPLPAHVWMGSDFLTRADCYVAVDAWHARKDGFNA